MVLVVAYMRNFVAWGVYLVHKAGLNGSVCRTIDSLLARLAGCLPAWLGRSLCVRQPSRLAKLTVTDWVYAVQVPAEGLGVVLRPSGLDTETPPRDVINSGTLEWKPSR